MTTTFLGGPGNADPSASLEQIETNQISEPAGPGPTPPQDPAARIGNHRSAIASPKVFVTPGEVATIW